MIELPVATGDPNVRALARLEVESFTGVTGASLTLAGNPVEAYTFIFKNGALLHNIAGADFTLSGSTVTLAVGLIAADKVTVIYWERGS